MRLVRDATEERKTPGETSEVGEIEAFFISWTLANGQAIAGGREEFSVELAGKTWTQKPQKYHAKSLAGLRQKYRAVAQNCALDAILDTPGCLAGLRA